MQFDLLNVQLYCYNKNAACRKNLLYTSRKHRDSNSIAVYLIKLKKKQKNKKDNQHNITFNFQERKFKQG